jgi:hypothetical protein
MLCDVNAATARAKDTGIYRAGCAGQNSIPPRCRSGVEYGFVVQRHSIITDTWFVSSGKPKDLTVGCSNLGLQAVLGIFLLRDTHNVNSDAARHEASGIQDNGLLSHAVSWTGQPWQSCPAESRI